MKTKTPRWLSNAIFYEIYPQTFYDSNRDGIGDLQGIIQKLDYLSSLGINAIWLNPCFESPFQDAGYDVANYYKVAPRYGTNAELEELFKKAGSYGIRVLLDLVPGHTSIEHPWFQQSQKAQNNPYSDWYIWNDSVWSGSEPDLTMIRGYSQRDASYLTNFFYCQPALNYGFAHPDPYHPWQQPVDAPGPRAVRQEIKNIMKFWLNKGASGFRVDMAASLVKRDPGLVETSRFWQEIRTWLDQEHPEAVIISEWGNPNQAIPAGFHIDMLLGFSNPGAVSLFRKRGIGNHRDPHAWSFFDESGHGDIRQFLDEYMGMVQATRDLGYIALITGNHDDHPRIADGRTMQMMKVVYTFMLTMPGTPIIYYGDEIGMKFQHGLASKEGGYIRTGVRTPMQWSDGTNGGFSSADPSNLYLPVGKEFQEINVHQQENDPDSLLNFVRLMVELRKKCPALASDGNFKPVYAESGKLPFIYRRNTENESYLIAVNPSATSVSHHLSSEILGNRPEILLSLNSSIERTGNGWIIKMDGVSSIILMVR
jgi:maltose alpha-D-glucosyltransferase/alpha-amylase